MKEILARIDVFEQKIFQVIEKLEHLKEENQKLIWENNRLSEVIERFKKNVEDDGSGKLMPSEDKRAIDNITNINIEQIREELDNCIEEIDHCLAGIGE